MDCDAGKKVLIRDDGGLVDDAGFPVTIIAQSDFEWNGDPRRGLGDYRIPYVMLTNMDGTKRNVDEYAPNKVCLLVLILRMSISICSIWPDLAKTCLGEKFWIQLDL